MMCHGGSLGVRVVLGEVGFTLVGHDLVLDIWAQAAGGPRDRAIAIMLASAGTPHGSHPRVADLVQRFEKKVVTSESERSKAMKIFWSGHMHEGEKLEDLLERAHRQCRKILLDQGWLGDPTSLDVRASVKQLNAPTDGFSIKKAIAQIFNQLYTPKQMEDISEAKRLPLLDMRKVLVNDGPQGCLAGIVNLVSAMTGESNDDLTDVEIALKIDAVSEKIN